MGRLHDKGMIGNPVGKRAERNHRSLQGELLAIIEAAARDTPRMTPREIFDEVRKLGLRTPDESAAIVRADRDRA